MRFSEFKDIMQLVSAAALGDSAELLIGVKRYDDGRETTELVPVRQIEISYAHNADGNGESVQKIIFRPGH